MCKIKSYTNHKFLIKIKIYKEIKKYSRCYHPLICNNGLVELIIGNLQQ